MFYDNNLSIQIHDEEASNCINLEEVLVALSGNWFDGAKVLPYQLASCYMMLCPLYVSNNDLLAYDGSTVTEPALNRQLLRIIGRVTYEGKSSTVHETVLLMKMMAEDAPIEENDKLIHFQNGTYDLANHYFTYDKQFTRNRLPVCFDPEAEIPVMFLQYLKDLYYEEDIDTLLKYLGYMLTSSTAAQVMLEIVGDPGIGKSQISPVIKAIMGNNCASKDFQTLATDKFSASDLVYKLAAIDDDITSKPITHAAVLQKIITSMGELELQRKHMSSIQGKIYVKLLGFGNFAAFPTRGDSGAFARRLMIVQAKPLEKGRREVKDIYKNLLAELPGITKLLVVGAQLLVDDNYDFHVSNRSKAAVAAAKQTADNLKMFMEESGRVVIEKNASATTKSLLEAYTAWCEDNVYQAMTKRDFEVRLQACAAAYGLIRSNNVYADGPRARGYFGIRIVQAV